MIKNKICMPKKIVQIFSLLFLIVGFFILANFINKTVLLSKNALAAYSCSTPNQEARRTDKQMCYKVCEGYGGYLKQDFKALKCCCKGNGIVPTPTTTPRGNTPLADDCIFNPSKTCPSGTTIVSNSGFCGCISNQVNTIPSPTNTLSSSPQIQTNKRCVDETSPLYDTPNNYLSWVEELKNGKWQMYQTCLYPDPVCDPNTFNCVAIGPTGPKKFGEKCGSGPECRSGQCNTKWIDSSGREVVSPIKQCTYSLVEQGKFENKRHDTDTKLSVAAAALLVATVTSPLMAPTFHVAAVAGLPAAANYLMLQLQEPWAQNTMATVNLTSTLYAISDCAKHGTNGEWCSMLAAVASNNPGQFGQVLGNDLKTISGNISHLNIGKYLNLTKTPGKEVMNIIETERSLTNPYPLTNPPELPKGKQLIGYTFQTNRGGTIRIDKIITTSNIEDVYQATLFEANGVSKIVTIKFPIDVSAKNVFGVSYSFLDQQILAQGQNSLPVNLRKNLARPYGFAIVETNVGKVELPIVENLGAGQTLEELMKNSSTGKITLSRVNVKDLYDAAKKMDLNQVYIGNVGPQTIWVKNDGTLIFFNPKYRPGGFGDFSVQRQFSQSFVLNHSINTSSPLAKEIIYFNKTSSKWIWDVSAGNIMALDDMFELWGNNIIIK